LVDQLDLCVADVIIDARPVFGSSGRSSVGTANGWFSKVVSEGCSLKDSAFAGKSSSRFRDKKLQMRGILATPTTPIPTDGSDQGEIERASSLCKLRQSSARHR
jgi:hypothetical protein